MKYMAQDIIDALKTDELLLRLCERIAKSERMKAAALELYKRVEILDILEQAGKPQNNASALIIFDGGRVTSVLNVDESLQIRGGGFVPLPRKGKGVT
jgi:hypothetical protein